MNVLHVVPSFYPAHVYGGPIESVYQLCRYLVKNGCAVRVLTTDANGLGKVLDVEKDKEVELAKDFRVRYCKRLIRHSVSLKFLVLLPYYIHWADVVHLTAVYSFPTIPTLLVCKVLGKPVVWSPRGALQRWEGSTRLTSKAIWEKVCQAVASKRLIFHVTSKEEAIESLQRFPGVKPAIIPNGIEIPEKVTRIPGDGGLRLLYLGRIQPKKGIDNLLAACKMLHSSYGIAWSLTIAGAGEPAYTKTILAKIEELMLSEHVKIVGEVVGGGKQKLFENSDLTLVPSFTENFGMVVAESLAHGVPVIASRGTPWRQLEEMGCGLWVENDPQSFARAIEQMSKAPLSEMGQRGREWMERVFSWELKCGEMLQVYKKLMDS